VLEIGSQHAGPLTLLRKILTQTLKGYLKYQKGWKVVGSHLNLNFSPKKRTRVGSQKRVQQRGVASEDNAGPTPDLGAIRLEEV
jgi:hypothetical protein